MSGGRTPPRVLLADDHPEMLKLASSTLQETCDVVATVTDGLRAVEHAIGLQPDVVILDITMPGLDGFQAARELRRRGSRAKIVFLSMHEGDEFVAKAFEVGGQGFVSKSRTSMDLPSAVTHVHAGRVFLTSLSSLSAVAPRGGHAVMLYSRHDAWCDESARLVRAALTRGDAVVLFAPEATRAGVAKKLRTLGLDTTRAVADGRYVTADAAESLQQIMCDGRPDAPSIAAVVANLEDTRLALSGPGSRMTLVGEIAACLDPDQYEAMLSIERLWNELVGDRAFLSVCGYSKDHLGGSAHSHLWSNVCAEHWAVSQALDV